MGVRKSIWLTKLSDEVLVWFQSEARCMLFAYGLADATASENPIISCLNKIQTGFTLLVLAYPDCPGKEAAIQYKVQ